MLFRSKMAKRPVDLNNIKGRIAEALVESIFRRAEFKMTRFGRESDLRGMMKSGKDESFTPDFLAMKEVVADSPGVYQTHMIEVKYRSNLVRYLEEEKTKRQKSELVPAKEKWPHLCLVFVTENAGARRSCFQALDLAEFEPGRFLRTVDLHEITRFDLFPDNVQQHEELARKMFGLMSEIEAEILP